MKKRDTVSSDFLKSVVGKITLPKLVESIREGEDWTKGEIANVLGVKPSYYSDFLSGEKIISMKTAAEWARILGYSESRFVELSANAYLEKHGCNVRLKRA